MNQKCSKMTITGVFVLFMLVIIGALTIWFWPNGDNMETKLETNGNDNKIETTEKKEVSLFHIEELSSAQTNSNIITLIGFTTIFLAIRYAISHIKFIKGPKRAKKEHERANMMDRLTEMEEVMLEMGYLKRKKNLKKNKKTKTQNLTRKKFKTKTRKNTIEDSLEDESDN